MGAARRGPLPFREPAFVAESKLGYYLDEARRNQPGSKVKLVRDVLGFSAPGVLRAAIVAHAQQNDAERLPDRGHGQQYNVTGPMVGPSGVVMRIVSGWILEPESRTPRNVTMFPAPKRGG